MRAHQNQYGLRRLTDQQITSASSSQLVLVCPRDMILLTYPLAIVVSGHGNERLLERTKPQEDESYVNFTQSLKNPFENVLR